MARQTVVSKKRKKRGPPATGHGTPVMVRLHGDLLKPLDQWIKDQPAPKPSRPDAVRRALHDWLTGLGLVSDDKPRSNQRGRNKSADMAGQAIDAITDQSAPAEARASRKRRLLKGPKEFRAMRDDESK
jgi:hypothetical protein